MSDINSLITRGVANIIPNRKDLLEKLTTKKLNVYLGIDPTSTKIHLGHAVSLLKLQKFADLGHNVTFLIGDFTALIGDTSDKESERPALTTEQIKQNFKTYKSQAEKIINFEKIKVKHNSEWLSKLTFEDVVKLTQHFSLGDFTSRELIKKRMQKEDRVGLHEVLYPVMQGYDSYILDTDIQIGGTDQTFNMQAGRALQKILKNKDSFVLTTEFLSGTDGRKMSKTWGNAVWLNDTPQEMYIKLMRMDDETIIEYTTLLTDLSVEKMKQMKNDNPMEAKKVLAHEIVQKIHGKDGAEEASQNFQETIQERKVPQDLKIVTLDENELNKLNLPELIVKSGSTYSISQAKRLISDGAVQINDKKVTDFTATAKSGSVIRVGKKHIFKVK